jgi:hypothetical protein
MFFSEAMSHLGQSQCRFPEGFISIEVYATSEKCLLGRGIKKREIETISW